MSFVRREIDRISYKNRTVIARSLQPDFVGEIDGVEMPHAYVSTTALFDCAKKSIDEAEKVKADESKPKKGKPRGK